MRHHAAVFARVSLIGLALLSHGCTLLGFGIGSAVPRAPKNVDLRDLASVSPGTEIEVVYAARPTDDRPVDAVRAVRGTYGGVQEGSVVVQSAPAHTINNGGAMIQVVHHDAIPLEDVRRVQAGPSSYATEGTLIGLGVDVAIVATFVVLGLVIQNAIEHTD